MKQEFTNLNDQAQNEEIANQTKLDLEIAELRQKLKWEPLKSTATFLGVFVVLFGLAVERFNLQSQRSFEIKQNAHTQRISAMSKISYDVSVLCQETFRVIRGHDRIRIFGSAMSRSLSDKIKQLAKQGNSTDQAEIDYMLEELSIMEAAFSSQRNQYEFWVDALALEGKWLLRKQSPAPDFALYFDHNLSKKWGALAEEMLSQLEKEFAILSDSNSDHEKVSKCIEYVTELEMEIAVQNRAFLNGN